MAQNFLEQLVAEWYEYQGYFVRRNINVGRRAAGGYECELDIIAFDPKSRNVIHIEPSMDAQSWAQRTERYKKKFRAGQRYIPTLFEGLDIVGPIEQIALFVFASNKVKQTITINYRWQEAANANVAFVNLTNTGVYSNTSNATLTISDNTGLDGYIYRVQLSAAGVTANTVSANATLTELP